MRAGEVALNYPVQLHKFQIPSSSVNSCVDGRLLDPPSTCYIPKIKSIYPCLKVTRRVLGGSNRDASDTYGVRFAPGFVDGYFVIFH